MNNKTTTEWDDLLRTASASPMYSTSNSSQAELAEPGQRKTSRPISRGMTEPALDVKEKRKKKGSVMIVSTERSHSADIALRNRPPTPFTSEEKSIAVHKRMAQKDVAQRTNKNQSKQKQATIPSVKQRSSTQPPNPNSKKPAPRKTIPPAITTEKKIAARRATIPHDKVVKKPQTKATTTNNQTTKPKKTTVKKPPKKAESQHEETKVVTQHVEGDEWTQLDNELHDQHHYFTTNPDPDPEPIEEPQHEVGNGVPEDDEAEEPPALQSAIDKEVSDDRLNNKLDEQLLAAKVSTTAIRGSDTEPDDSPKGFKEEERRMSVPNEHGSPTTDAGSSRRTVSVDSLLQDEIFRAQLLDSDEENAAQIVGVPPTNISVGSSIDSSDRKNMDSKKALNDKQKLSVKGDTTPPNSAAVTPPVGRSEKDIKNALNESLKKLEETEKKQAIRGTRDSFKHKNSEPDMSQSRISTVETGRKISAHAPKLGEIGATTFEYDDVNLGRVGQLSLDSDGGEKMTLFKRQETDDALQAKIVARPRDPMGDLEEEDENAKIGVQYLTF